jgi:uncharacterized damage-inducible protein DinB
MSERADWLAEHFGHAVDVLRDLLAECTDEDWQQRCPDEERPVGVVAHHVAGGLRVQTTWLQTVASGQQLPPVTTEMIDEQNAGHAVKHAHHSKEETLATLRRNSAEAASVIRGLTDAQLDRQGWMPLFGERPFSAEEIVRYVIIRHIITHTRSIRAAFERPADDQPT